MLRNLTDASRELGVTPVTLRRHIKSGTLPAYSLGGRNFLIDVDEVRSLARLKKQSEAVSSPGEEQR